MSNIESKMNQKAVQRELALVKVEAEGHAQDQALCIVGQWSGRLLELNTKSFTAEMSGDPEKVSRFLAALVPFGLAASFRTGAVSLH